MSWSEPLRECTEEEFSDLLKRASEMSSDEARSELLECARYGETDAIRAILDHFASSDLIDHTDAGGSTALHKACANGHDQTARLLISRGASYKPNVSGNTPLHWAAANGHEKAVQVLLQAPHFRDQIDVLQKNSFGRSALTEGFASGNTLVVGSLLEHDTAEEERLIGGKDEGDNKVISSPVDKDLSKEKKGVTHAFDFCTFRKPSSEISPKTSYAPLLVRELPMEHPDDPFGAKAEEDTTGLAIWCASLVMARWVSSPNMVERFRDKNVLELGAGCGVPSLAAALYSTPNSVQITDLNPTTIQNMTHNIDINNFGDTTVNASTIDWTDPSTWPTQPFDVILGSDLIYQSSIVPLLKPVIASLCKPNGVFMYVAPKDYTRDGLVEFIREMKVSGFECVVEEDAPEKYRWNPLVSGDEDDCFLHFHELASTNYILYEFRRVEGESKHACS